VCKHLIVDGAGVFCGNYSSKRGTWTACKKVWCSPCYTPLDNEEFPIARAVDEDRVEMEDSRVEMEDSRDEHRFKQAQNGDSLVTPFQCDFCHFRNLMSRDPVERLAQDVRLLKCIRRANLDAFWSREPTTISNNLTVCRQGLSISAAMGFKHKLFRPMGPFPVDDTFGMGAAVVMLQMSLQPGRNNKFMQFSSVRKFRSAFSNAHLASAEGQQATVLAKDNWKMIVTKCPFNGDFFERFVRGLHKRMGDVVKQDKALLQSILKEIFSLLDEEWAIRYSNKYGLAREGAFYLVAYCCALWGEETVTVDLYGTRKH
jgi:hypothetical protein